MKLYPSFVCVFIMLFAAGSAIRCFECNSANNSMCLDPSLYSPRLRAANLRPIECGEQTDMPGSHEFFCRKLVQTILNKDRGPDVRVTRGCGWVRHHRDCYNADTENHLEISCQCFNDECNGAASLQRSLSLLFPVAIVGFYWKG